VGVNLSAVITGGEAHVGLESFGVGLFGAVCLLGGITGSAHAQCVEYADFDDNACATEWSGGSVFNLGGLPGYSSYPTSINNAGQVVGYSEGSAGLVATEWSGGSVINLGGLPGSTQASAAGINDAGRVVGYSVVGGADIASYRVERRQSHQPRRPSRVHGERCHEYQPCRAGGGGQQRRCHRVERRQRHQPR
jgi:probable HAF family extracellular repeat protein